VSAAACYAQILIRGKINIIRVKITITIIIKAMVVNSRTIIKIIQTKTFRIFRTLIIIIIIKHGTRITKARTITITKIKILTLIKIIIKLARLRGTTKASNKNRTKATNFNH
jgi:hypothetical protein